MTGSSWSAPFVWTPEQVTKLTKLYRDDGLTGMEVAELMGISRNKVIGKLNRLGLLGDRGPSNQFKSRMILRVPKPPRAAAPKKESAERSIVPPTTAPPLPALPKPRKSHWKGMAAEVDVIRPGECRYPLGEPLDPSTRFCRAPAVPHKSYCKYHQYLTCKKPNEPREWYEDNPKRIKGDYRQWKPLDRGT